MIVADKETRAKRRAVCSACPLRNGVFCGKCGCLLAAVTLRRQSTCPAGKW